MLITITAKEGNKIIEQFDVDVHSRGWVSQDYNGDWWYFDRKPKVIGKFFDSFESKYPISIHAGEPNPDWNNSLIDLSKIK